MADSYCQRDGLLVCGSDPGGLLGYMQRPEGEDPFKAVKRLLSPEDEKKVP